MKKLFFTAACIATAMCSFANPATDKNKKNKEVAPTINAVVTAQGTRIIVTAITNVPSAIDVIMEDEQGNEVYEGKLVKGEYTQSAIFNLEGLSEGTYSIVLQNGKDKLEKKIAVNTTKLLSVE